MNPEVYRHFLSRYSLHLHLGCFLLHLLRQLGNGLDVTFGLRLCHLFLVFLLHFLGVFLYRFFAAKSSFCTCVDRIEETGLTVFTHIGGKIETLLLL